MEKAAIAAGASPTWAGMPVLTVVLWGGVLTQILWAFGQHRRNLSFGDYAKAGFSQLRNIMLSVGVGVIGVMQFVLQKAGEPLMGDFRYISFAVLMSSAVFFSALLGVMLGEWKGTSPKTRLLLASGIAILAVGFSLMALGGR
jgi:L-rhamnose-H+ transport protein